MSESPPPVNELIDQISAGSNALAGQTAQALDQVSQTAAEIASDIQSAVPALAQAGSPGPAADTVGSSGGAGSDLPEPIPGDATLLVPSPALPVASELRRLLAIEVPIIVQLGARRMTVGEVMRFSVGAILEFQKGSDDELELLAANKAIGKGFAVKVGENFGIKLSSVGSVKETIRKLGIG